MQLAKHFGADVTAVCDTKNVELVRSLGADRVIDYTREDYTKAGDAAYDVVFDAVGKTSFRRCRRLLKRGGRFVETDLGFMWHAPALALLTRWFGDKRVTPGHREVHKGRRPLPQGAHRAGRVPGRDRPVVPLEHVVEATRYVETGQKTGNVVLTVGHNGSAATR